MFFYWNLATTLKLTKAFLWRKSGRRAKCSLGNHIKLKLLLYYEKDTFDPFSLIRETESKFRFYSSSCTVNLTLV